MCGIGGIFNFGDHQKITTKQIDLLSESLSRRGPDSSGKWISNCGKINFVHRRLSIIDTAERSNQPMLSEDSKVIIIFNGEIYNYLELKKDLEKKYKFYTTGDTEVIINLYREYGLDFINKLRGMFSIAIWDDRKKILILTRDRNGIKPLYYGNNGKTLIFASQVKSIIKSNLVNNSPDPAGWCSFFIWGNLTNNYTTQKHIKSILPGQTLIFNYYGKIINNKIYPIVDLYRPKSNTLLASGNIVKDYKGEIEKSILKHTISDVPIGIFLSGGIDSAIICEILNRFNCSKNVTAVTMGFEEFKNTEMDEIRFAQKISKNNNMNHIFFRLQKRDFFDDLPDFFNDMDQPTIDGLNSWFISKFVKKNNLKVVLSGIGADEIFSGYPSFNFIPKIYRLMGFFPKNLGKITRHFLSKFTYLNSYSPKLSSFFEYSSSIQNLYLLKRGLFMPWELNKILDGNFVKEGIKELNIFENLKKTFSEINNIHFKISALETIWYLQNRLLRDADWCGMSHSLEIRTPYIDTELLTAIAPMLNQEMNIANKNILKNSFAEFLPKEIMKRKKIGFEMPLSKWLKEYPEEKKFYTTGRNWSSIVAKQFLNSNNLENSFIN
jgi:asparagine synthase (glutamine-hydrolysing)